MNEPVPLKFDPVNVDNQLAIDYLKKNKSEFRSAGLVTDCNTDKYVLDNYNNKVYYTKINYFHKNFGKHGFELCTDKTAKMRELAKKIEENAELFCQLENLIRGKCKEQVKNCDIKLIVQNLFYWSTQTNEINIPLRHIVMAEETPLVVLGIVAQLLMYNEFSDIKSLHYITIEASRNTAAACYLFTELCHQVGLKSVNMIVSENSATIDLNNFDELKTGCTGVITSHSDVDSAVDALLGSTTKYPWKLRRILIQDSVYESVKKILEFKCNLKPTPDVGDTQLSVKIGQMCSNAFVYEGKKFLLDYAGDVSDIGEETQVILVEGYRTPKELIALLANYNPFYLSLWSSDIAEANEIAFGVRAAIVWVNDFGIFDGPWKASQAFYSVIEMKMSRRIGSTYKCDKLVKLREAWSKVDYYKRIEIVNKAVDSYVQSEDMSDQSADFVNKLRNSLSDCWNPKSDLVDIQKGKMCIVMDDSIEVIVISDKGLSLSYCSDYIDVIMSLVAGNAVSITSCKYSGLFHILVQRGLPVLFTDSKIYESSNQVPGCHTYRIAFGRSCHLTKAVYKNFGTIFAN